jgi:histidinol-phosphatase
LNETYDALDGAGARFNGKPMRVSDSDWDEATLVFSNWEGFSHAGMKSGFTSLADKAWRVRGFGDFWGHMLVARGAAEVMVEPELSLWDVAALEPIVRQAGGRITGIDGAPWKKGPLITTNGALHARTLELLRAQDA